MDGCVVVDASPFHGVDDLDQLLLLRGREPRAAAVASATAAGISSASGLFIDLHLRRGALAVDVLIGLVERLGRLDCAHVVATAVDTVLVVVLVHAMLVSARSIIVTHQ
jgi:hypothetical protein